MEVGERMKESIGKVIKGLGAYKYVLLVIAVGLLLLLWPNAPPTSITDDIPLSAEQVAVHTLEQALKEQLNRIDGVGRAELLLTENGALVVCDGAADPGIRMKVLEAVSSVTNLSYDKISVIKMKR
jgi:hypothetical protein